MRTSQATATNNGVPPAQGMARSGLGASTGQRLPVPPRERKPALAALAVLLILGGALISAYLVMQSGQRVSAIQLAQDVPAGQQIPAGALQEVQIGDTGINFIAWAHHAEVTQAYALVPLVKGALLTNGMVTPASSSTNGRVVVGLSLKAGQYPAGGLVEGQHVALFAVAGQNTTGPRPGTLLADDAIVYLIGKPSANLQTDQTPVNVSVPPDQAALLIQAASGGQVGVALLPGGTRVSGTPGNADQQQNPAPRQSTPRSPVTPTGLRSP